MKTITVGMAGFGSIAKVHCMAAVNIALHTEIPVKIGKIYRRKRETPLPFMTAGYADSIESLIKDSDVIDVCSSNDAHFEQARQVIHAGKALYLEKPVGIDGKQADALAQMIGETPVKNQVALMYRFMPAVAVVRDLAAVGDIGEIIDFQCQVQHSGYLDPGRRSNWKLKKNLSGGGPLLDIGIHIADMIRFTLGEVLYAECKLKTVIGKRIDQETGERIDVDVEDSAWARLYLENGVGGTVEITRVASVLDQSSVFSVYGTKGSIRFDASAPDRLTVYHQGNNVQTVGKISPLSKFGKYLDTLYFKDRFGWMTDAHTASQLCFYQRISGNEGNYPEIPDIKEAVKSQRIIDACYRSADAGGSLVKVEQQKKMKI